MGNGWVKVHRKILNNEMLRFDNNAFVVFTRLLLIVDKNTGSWCGGRYQLAEHMNMNPNTLYSTIKRLEKAGIVNTYSNTKFTRYSICNWSKYQQDDNSQTTTRQQPDNTLTRRKKEEEYTIVEQSSEKADEIKQVYELYIQSFGKNPNTFKLSPKRKIKIAARLKDAGKDMLLQAIRNTASNSFYTGDNQRGWKADLDWITKGYENVEKLANMGADDEFKHLRPSDLQKNMQEVL